jgi:hypothetical protein
MFTHLCILCALAATPTSRLHREATVMRPDGRPVVVRLIAQDEWIPLEGARWWVEVDGKSHRLDAFGFETNYGPLYQSPEEDRVIVFRTFRNTVEGGLCFDLVTGRVSETHGEPATFEAKGWTRRAWQPVVELE